MNASIRRRSGSLALALGLIITLLFLCQPPVISCLVEGGIRLFVWPRAVMFHARWPLAALCLVVAAAAWRLTAPTEGGAGGGGRWPDPLRPLAGLPLLAAALLLADLLPLGWAGNLILFAPAIFAGLTLARILERHIRTRPDAAPPDRWIAAGLFAGLWILYFLVGLRFSRTVGEHIGDEGHYILIAQSLYEDGDLDIRDDMLRDLGMPAEETVNFGFMHVAPNSRGEHWYSQHPFGLSVLLAAVWPGGRPARQALLALIGALGIVGSFRLCRRAGASSTSAALAACALGCGAYWAIYAVRALPEMLGAVLLVWTVWGIFAQRDRPWTATLLAAAACAYLPFAHTRFIPLSGIAAGLFGLHGLRCTDEPWPRRGPRLAAFGLLTCAGYALYLAAQHRMYEGGYYTADSGMLFSFLPGAWGVIADRYGALPVFPLLFWFLPATVAWLCADPGQRPAAGTCLALFLASVLLLGTSKWYTGGSSLPGRYLVAVMPMLMPGAAIMLDRAGSRGRRWFLFLASWSALLLALILAALPHLNREFIFPLEYLQREPLFQGLFHPHAPFLYPATATARVWTSIYAAAGMLLTFTWLRWPWRAPRRDACLLAALAAIGTVAHLAQFPPGERPHLRRDRLARLLRAVHADRAWFARQPHEPPIPAEHLFPPKFLPTPAQTFFALTTADLGAPQLNGTTSQPQLPVNDWAGRGYRWATVTEPFRPPVGEVLLQLTGERTGAAAVILAVRHGSHTILETPLPIGSSPDPLCRFVLRPRSGDLYILVRMSDGEGTLRITKLVLAPCHPAMVEGWNLVLPGS